MIGQEQTRDLTSLLLSNVTGNDDPFVYHYDRYNPLSKMMAQLYRLRDNNPSIVSIIGNCVRSEQTAVGEN